MKDPRPEELPGLMIKFYTMNRWPEQKSIRVWPKPKPVWFQYIGSVGQHHSGKVRNKTQ